MLRDEMIAAVWPATVVGDNNLNMQIGALRRVLDEGRADGSCIETVPGRGYRFTAPVTRISGEAEPPLPDKPSIAVLPFQNLSGDPEQEYFADGMVEESLPRCRASRGSLSSPATRASPTRAKRST